MKNILVLLILGSFSISSIAQTIDDALRYSKTNLSGSARYVSMGGAFGALGGDISAIATNPAAAGVFMYSEMTITPTFYHSHSETNFLGNTTNDGRFNFNLNDIGIVGNVKTQNKDWVAINYAFSYNRLDNYNNRIYAEGINNNNSITDYFADQGYGTTLGSLDDGTGGSDLVYNAYNTYLINPLNEDPNNIEYQTTYNTYGEQQIHRIETSGYRSNYSFSLATNYRNKLYVGISFNYTNLRYTYRSDFQEHDVHQKIDDFKSLRYYDEYETRGNGFAFKVGFIYKAAKWLRIGTSFHTPIVYNLNDNYSHLMESWVTVDGKTNNYTMPSSNGYYDYKINSPLRMMGALAFILGKHAILSTEYEYLNHTLAKISSHNNNNLFAIDNEMIKETFKPTHNFKLGFEYRLGKLSLRTGASYYDSPYQADQINQNAYTIYYNAGIGLNLSFFYIDFAYSRGTTNYSYYAYQLDLSDTEPYQIQQTTNKYVTTFGIRF